MNVSHILFSSSENAAFKDLSLHRDAVLAKSFHVDSLNVVTETTSNGIHASNQVNGVPSKEHTPPSSSVDSEAIKHSQATAASEPSYPSVDMTHDMSHKSTLIAEDPAFHQPVSDVREHVNPVSDEQATQIKEAKQLQDLAVDSDLAGAITDGANRTTNPSTALPTGNEDVMDTSMVSDDSLFQPSGEDVPPTDTTMTTESTLSVSNVELPHHPAVPMVDGAAPELPVDPAPTPAVIEQHLSPQQDQVMQDVPKSPGKVARSREEEDIDDGPASKRTRTDDDASSVPEFKVPDLPQSAVDRSSPNSTVAMPHENGAKTAPLDQVNQSNTSQPMTKPQQRFLLKGLQTIKKVKEAVPFAAPVDPVALNIPSYPDIVKNPMDLRTMEEKMKADQYASVDAYVADFNQVVQNSETFNGRQHLVTQNAYFIKGILEKQLSNLPGPDVVDPPPAAKKSKKASVSSTTKATPARRESRATGGNVKSPTTTQSPQTFALGPQGVPLIRRDSTATDGRPKREIHPPAPRDLPYANQKPKKKKFQLELRFCQEIINEMKKPKHHNIASPFTQPVDPVALNIPHYHKLIKKPMDLSTIEKKLVGGEYENAKEFEADVRLMFANCYRFNPSTDVVHHLGKQLEAIFDQQWAMKKQWLDEHAPASGPQSPGSSPEPDDDDEEEEEDDEETEDQLTILQKQIAAMSKQVEMIQKKKSSPPAPNKKAANIGRKVKKETAVKKGGSVVPAKSEKKATSKPVKKERPPIVTYEQKQDISNRINSLPASRMATALSIIRDNMPNLKVIHNTQMQR